MPRRIDCGARAPIVMQKRVVGKPSKLRFFERARLKGHMIRAMLERSRVRSE
jgi:hypothetical protein